MLPGQRHGGARHRRGSRPIGVWGAPREHSQGIAPIVATARAAACRPSSIPPTRYPAANASPAPVGSTGRVGRAIELDPYYVAAAIGRWQALTGEAAVHAETGQKFDELAAVAARAADAA